MIFSLNNLYSNLSSSLLIPVRTGNAWSRFAISRFRSEVPSDFRFTLKTIVPNQRRDSRENANAGANWENKLSLGDAHYAMQFSIAFDCEQPNASSATAATREVAATLSIDEN